MKKVGKKQIPETNNKELNVKEPKKQYNVKTRGAETLLVLRNEVNKLRDENSNLNRELDSVRVIKEKEQYQQENLAQELTDLKNKLLLVEQIKDSLEAEHVEVTDRMKEALIQLDSRITTAESKNEAIETGMTKVKTQLENTEAEEADRLVSIDKEWSEKYKEIEVKGNEQIHELKNKHSSLVQEYENTIAELKKEVLKKCKEITKLEKQLQEQCLRMQTEVTSIKQDMEQVSKESELKLNAKLASYQAKIVKLNKSNKKIKQYYENKIKTLNKVIEIEKLNIGSTLTNTSQQEFQKTVTVLEEKFRQQLSETIKWANRHNELELKKKAIITELEEQIGHFNTINF